MKPKPLPPLDYLNSIFIYNPVHGSLHYRSKLELLAAGYVRKAASRCALKLAGTVTLAGYTAVRVLGQRYLKHRICWYMHTGVEPVALIDHKNLDTLDDSFLNLREATKAENEYNTTERRNNTSGFKNVCWHKQKGKWRAYITKGGKQTHLGLFTTPEAAHAAVVSAAHRLHGDFARA